MTHLKEGDKAPHFKGIDQDGNSISLDDYTNKKLVLYFYPKDNTPGCTAEACNLRDNYAAFQAKGYEIVGVSPDSAKKHQNFINKFDLPFPLLADTELETIKAYGLWGEKKFMGRIYDGVHRMTFIIDENGVLEQIFRKVKTKTHSEQIFETVG